ncbi:hypothetical protein D6D08_05204 [Aureobasidium pullulans]|nr:hypothetical protein D6D08_05204 [Aureobasidium pullulans]
MNFYPIPPVIEAQVLTRIPDDLRCKGSSDWRGGFTGNFQNIFLEGPTWDESGSLYVTDIPYGRILKIDQHRGETTVCVQYDGEPNGMARRKDGKFVVADHKKVSSVLKGLHLRTLNSSLEKGLLLFDPDSKEISPLLTRNNLESFKGVNDVIIDSMNNIFFTDQGQTGMTDQTGRVYRLGHDGRLDKLVDNGISPNGLALSLDERFLEIAQLEQRERDLRASLEEHNAPTLENGSSPAAGRHRGRRFVGDEVGLKIYHAPETQQPGPQDMFTILMIFAIAAVTMHRTGQIREHPYGYYLSAMRHLGRIPHTAGKQGVQNLLLVARFGIYHHVGTSLWELARQCMRACIEMEFHLPLIIPSRSPDLDKQHNQRIFWECYQLDRYSSTTLGRPFAIADHDIEVDLPSSTGLDTPDSLISVSTFATSSDLSVFIYSVQLRQITSRIRSKLLSMSSNSHDHHRSFMATGEIYTSLHKFLAELDHWRASAPRYEQPTCLYESQEWYDFLLEKDKLFLMRGGVNILFKSRRGVSQDIMRLWGRCATRVVELYASLYRAGRITYTRSYFQMLFHAGLSVIFCVSSEAKSRTGAGRLIPDFDATLSVCGNVLDSISEKMPDARGYAVVFESMRKSVFNNFSASPTTTAHPATPRETNMTLLAFPEMNMPIQQEHHPIMPISTQGQGQHQTSGATQAPVYSQWMPEMDWTNMDFDAMQGMEAGLSEYVWGDLNINADMWNRIEHMIDDTIDDGQ